MNRRRSKKAEQMRNLALLLLAVAVVALVIVIAVTSLKDRKNQSPIETYNPVQSGVSASGGSQSSKPNSSEPGSKTSDEAQSEPNSAVSQGSDAQSSSQPQVSTSGSESQPGADDPYYEPELPLLVNPTNKIPDGYSPELSDIGNGYKLESRAAAAFNKMLQKAWQDGISLWVVSAYRSHEKQTTNFENKIREFEGMGYNAEQAYAATAKLIAVPGTSEHSLGYAVDLNSLETDFEQTKQFDWLIENCADFGFILRYPKDKVDITEISYEPWHYRYVGSNHAQIIMEKGICLEEYLSGDY